ncbi:MAG: hypothetical protein GMKNLPBB_01185 [Myxococcota bacterium]|nr:hypothetical protein [Myxococcota bacterium]
MMNDPGSHYRLVTGLLPVLLLSCGTTVEAGPGESGASRDMPVGERPMPPAAFPATSFLRQPPWYDGKGEVSAYRSVIQRYNAPRRSIEFHVVVSETFNREKLVKQESPTPPGNQITVTKFNLVRHFQTGIYDYHQVASVFLDQQTAMPIKQTFTSAEWCGLTFKEILPRAGLTRMTVNTYWDPEASAAYELDTPRGVLTNESLPVTLRALPFATGAVFAAPMIPPQMSSRGPRPEIREARIVITGKENVTAPAGAFESWRVEADWGGPAKDVLWFAESSPHLLVKWDQAEGHRHELIVSKRLEYWKMNTPEWSPAKALGVELVP